MLDFSPDNFMKIIENKKDELINSKVEEFINYIKKQPFVTSCMRNSLSLEIKYESDLYDIPNNIIDILTYGGVVNDKLKKKPIVVKGFNK